MARKDPARTAALEAEAARIIDAVCAAAHATPAQIRESGASIKTPSVRMEKRADGTLVATTMRLEIHHPFVLPALDAWALREALHPMRVTRRDERVLRLDYLPLMGV